MADWLKADGGSAHSVVLQTCWICPYVNTTPAEGPKAISVVEGGGRPYVSAVRYRCEGGAVRRSPPHRNRAVTGPFLYTFTLRLPFILGMADGLDHDVSLPVAYADEEHDETFGRAPFVRVRMFNATIPDLRFSPASMPSAVEHFYGSSIEPSDEEDHHLYEQWISLETPAAFLVGEHPGDPTYAFHRSLAVLNAFLAAFSLARDDYGIRPISAGELRPIVMIDSGVVGEWTSFVRC